MIAFRRGERAAGSNGTALTIGRASHYLFKGRSSLKGYVLNKNPDDARSRKELAEEKRQRAAAEGRSAMAEIAARNAFVAKNTIRLRELRLAREAADREAQAALPPEPVKRPRKKQAGAA